MGSLTSSSWVTSLCGSPICSGQDATSCALKQMFDSSTCMNHLAVTGAAALLGFVLALQLLVKIPHSRASARQLVTLGSLLHLSALDSGCWMLGSNFSQDASTVYLPHWWLVTLSLDLNLVLTSVAFSIRPRFLGAASVRSWSVLLTVYAAFICCSSVGVIVAEKAITIKSCLDVLSLPGAVLLLLYGIRHGHDEEGYGENGNGLYNPLYTETESEVADSETQVTPFAKAVFFSKMTYWWLNPLMRMGYDNPLEDKDMLLLGTIDRAQNQYLMFMEKLNCRKQSPSHATPLFFWTIVSCHKRAILVSGFLALLKVLTLSTGPIILKAFVNVSLGKGTFRYEGHVLAALLFVSKCCESLSERQWNFRTRRLGLQVRSLLSAAIYKKQQKLSNAANMKHSSREIVNYETVDAYRIGEFPYWFHQTWTTSVQLCIAMAILYDGVGAAMISSLVVIILTVLCNAPLARFQHKFQSKLMEAQDVRLKAMSESLVHMKVLKLYPWEGHFKKVIEGLREVEYKWLSAFQLWRAYNSFLFWASPALVSVATFVTCYLLKIPLDASNVFTFVATLRLVQDPVRTIPDVISVVIQAKIQLCGKIAYVSQNAWIQTGTVQDNILFGLTMDRQRYHNTLVRCSLVKDLGMLPYGDCTQIGERGVNLSGGQKQRVQLARALYQNADIYLLDDPFCDVDAHTATSLFNEYVMGTLSDKTVLLVKWIFYLYLTPFC
ncbi:hypothetical protein ZWY2020_050596 [Hordeum vulgare]|nr:hypothetical protein ZWY2020_050596 [Hordeum vulgare]